MLIVALLQYLSFLSLQLSKYLIVAVAVASLSHLSSLSLSNSQSIVAAAADLSLSDLWRRLWWHRRRAMASTPMTDGDGEDVLLEKHTSSIQWRRGREVILLVGKPTSYDGDDGDDGPMMTYW